MRTFNLIVRNALTVSLLGIFSMSATQAVWASGDASGQGRQGPPCVTIEGQTYCEDGTGTQCVWIEGKFYCTP